VISSQDILFGVTGQSLFYDCPEGRPSSVVSATHLVDADDDTGTAEFTATGSVETNPNTTTDEECGAQSSQTDPNEIPLTATTGIVRGRRYLLTSAANGEREFVEIERFIAADAAFARSPLLNLYASGATFQSTRINVTVDATWVADDANLSSPARTSPHYRTRLVYVVDGVTYAASIFWDLVRYPFRHSVIGPDVDAFSPGWFDRLPVDDRRNQGERLIEEAARQVKEDLITRGLSDYGQRNSEFVNALVLRKAVVVGHEAAVNHGAIDQRLADRAIAAYFAYLDKTINNTVHQATEDGAGAETPRGPIWVR
jgi:hypothetical protein